MIKEIHLLIIWEKARYKEKEILKFVSNNFQLLDQFKIIWDKDKFSKNLSSFYGAHLPPKSNKESHCGNGEFLAVTFYDHNPKYDFVETSRGSEKVNINVFEMKNKFRVLTGGGHKIHTTNSMQETNHDLTLLLGINYNDYEKIILDKNKNDEKIITIKKNVAGIDGWKSLDELFYVINSTLDYVILRNFENLSNINSDKHHGDIDFLVNDLEKAIQITNANKVFKENYRVHFELLVNKKKIFADFRYVGDSYFDKNWQLNILKDRVLYEKKFYTPNNKDYFYSLIYHILIHKIHISSDYPIKLKKISEKIFNTNEKKLTFDDYFEELEKFLKKKKYTFVRPDDYSVFFDIKYTNYQNNINELSIINLSDIKPYLIHEWKNNSQSIYFIANNQDNKKVFIKSHGIEDSCRREFRIISELRVLENKYFPKPYYYRFNKLEKFFVAEYIEGKRLDKINVGDKHGEFKINFYNGMYKILKSLHKLKIIHRDIRPGNFIIKEDGTPVLVDFQFTVDENRKKYKEYKLVKKKPKIIATLGREHLKSRFYWDDAYSFYKIFDEIRDNDEEFLKIKADIKKLINKYVIISVSKNYFSKILILSKYYLSKIIRKI